MGRCCSMPSPGTPMAGCRSPAEPPSRIDWYRCKLASKRRAADPGTLEVIIAGCTTDPDGLINLGREGVGRVLLTIWQEDRDEILRNLDAFEHIKDAVYGSR